MRSDIEKINVYVTVTTVDGYFLRCQHLNASNADLDDARPIHNWSGCALELPAGPTMTKRVEKLVRQVRSFPGIEIGCYATLYGEPAD